MRAIPTLTSLLLIAGCGAAVGTNKTQCEEDPASCSSVREAYQKSNGPVTPPPSEAALQTSDVMRVWVAPMRSESGVLSNSGMIFLE